MAHTLFWFSSLLPPKETTKPKLLKDVILNINVITDCDSSSPTNLKSTLTFKYQIDIRIVLWELTNWMFVAVTL